MSLIPAEKLSDPQPYLHGVYSRIQVCQPCVRDVHVAQFEAHVVARAKDVYPEGGLIGEVHRVGAGGDVVIGEEGATAQFQVG